VLFRLGYRNFRAICAVPVSYRFGQSPRFLRSMIKQASQGAEVDVGFQGEYADGLGTPGCKFCKNTRATDKQSRVGNSEGPGPGAYKVRP
jgi:hypothetical protein